MLHKNLIVTIAIGLSCCPIPGAVASNQPNDLQQLLAGKTYGNILAPEDYSYADGNISLKKGQPIADGLSLNASKLKDFSPATALQAAGVNLDLSKTQLGELKYLTKVSVKDLVEVDATLKNITAESIGWVGQGAKTLSEIASAELGKLPLPESVLKSNNIASFGNIANTSYGSFPGADQLPISNFPGLSNVPIAKTVGNITGVNTRLVRVNKILTNEKNFNAKVVSGSDQKPLAKWDKGTPVSGVELLDSVMTDKSNLANGAVAIIGSSQMLPGGNVPSPLEPTGLDIPGTPFKVSFENPDAKKGSVQLQLNMRLEYAFGLKTSHFIPIPTGIEVTEKSKTTLLPLEVPLPTSIASLVPEVIAATTKATSLSPKDATVTAQKPSTTEEQPSSPESTEQPSSPDKTAETKQKALGAAVKSSTNPITSKTL
jgi:hypothetical protein